MRTATCLAGALTFFLAMAAPLRADVIFGTNATFRYFKGRSEASSPDATAWRQVGFNDSAWAVGSAPFYYGESLTGTLLNDMQGGYSTFYLRRTFVLTNLAAVTALQIDAVTDDGHIVWINGVEVGRFNVAAGERPYSATASSAIEATANRHIMTNLSSLVNGTNVIAVQAFNSSLSGSSDFVFYSVLTTPVPDLVAPTVASVTPSPGTVSALASVSVVFSEPVAGVNASDLLVNGVPATGVTGGNDTYTFSVAAPAYGPVAITWSAAHGIADLAIPAHPFDATGAGATWQYTLVDLTPPAALILPFPGSTVRSLSQIEVDFDEPVTGVDATDLWINDVPSSSVVALSPANYVFRFPAPAIGPVAVAWSADHGIQDLADVANRFGGGSWSYLLDPDAPVNTVRINELVAANVNGLRDEENEPQDWIELYNTSATAVNLAGWSLTDDPNDPERWIFPGVTLPARGYLIVFCSGKDRKPTTPGSRLHTNFKLDPDGEYLALFNAEVPRQAISVFEQFPNQRTDYSYGYDATEQLRYFPTPTPGAANGSSTIAGIVADPKFSQKRGFYTNAFSLALTSATPSATIRYTVNGTAPSLTSGLVYTSPLVVTGTTVLRAAAFRTGYLASEVACQTYLFLGDVIRQSPTGAAPAGWPSSWGANTVDYGMDPDIVNSELYRNTIRGDLLTIPSFSIVMNVDDLFGSSGIYANPGGDSLPWERACSLELIYPDGADGFQINAGIRIRGGFSRSTDNPKHAFRFFFRQDYGSAKLNFPVFGPGGATSFDKFDLRTMQNYSWSYGGDSRMICLRDQLGRDQQLAMTGNATRGHFYHLYINGQYWGLYDTEERPEAAFGESYYGGRAEDYDTIKVDPDLGYNIEATDGNTDAWRRLWDAAAAGFGADADYFRVQGLNVDGTPNPAYETLLDVTNLVDYMLVILYGGNLDSPISNFLNNDSPNNWYGIRNRTGQYGGFRFFVHDAEHTLLDVNADRTGPYPAGDPAQGSSFAKSNPQYLWQRLQANPEFRMFVADRVQRHCARGGPLSVEGVRSMFLSRSNEIDRAIVGESARWGDAKTAAPMTRTTWLSAMTSVGGFISARTAVLLNQLRADGLFPAVTAPLFSLYGGAVPSGFALYLTNANSGGVLYYTLTGADPRLRGGAIAPSALAYSPGTPIPIQWPTLVRARVRSGSTWSPITEALFYPPQSFANLHVTELMYHPPALGRIDGDEFEFIEFKNVGTNDLDLGGLTFAEGIQFTFTNGTRIAPGHFLVLGRNPAQFTAKYPGLALDGVYTGKLDNGGERLRLITPLGTPALSVEYKDSGRWPLAPDGYGFSLVPREPGGNPNPDNPGHWRASALAGGSPGGDDPPSPIPGVVVNEVLTHTLLPVVDAIELHNPTAADADISGWFLTDDAAVPNKFRIPDGTVIAAGGYVVFTEADFNPMPGTNSSFSLNSGGDDVHLIAADASGNLTGYSHGFSFGAAPSGVSFGRHVISTGDEHLVLQSAATLGGLNAGPSVGPVVFRQIMYHPPDLPGGVDNPDDEFIELRNITTFPVPLYDAAVPTNTWRLRGGIAYEFPEQVVLAPGASLVLVSFPLTNAAAIAAFRGKFGGLEGLPLFGPYRNKLDNSSDTLELQRPDAPDTNGVPYVVVDQVDYRDAAPWPPSADGSGAVLQRVDLAAYGDDPANWMGYAPLTIMAVTPALAAVRAGTNAATFTNVTFAVDAVGTGDLAYQWRKDGVDLPGATNRLVTITNVQLPDDGQYTVRVTDTTGTLESAPVMLGVLVNPVIVQAPLSQSVVAGGWVTLSCQITGNPPPFTYEWRRGSTTLWTNISNDRLSFYTFQAPNVATSLQYRVVVKNLALSVPGVSHSVVATIAVLGDADGDGLPDSWETAYGLNPASAADAAADSDHDGVSNRDEYLAGTNPAQASSRLEIDTLLVDGTARLTFPAISNKTYTVLYKDDPAAPSWSKLADILATPTNRVVGVLDPTPTNRRLYRVTTPELP